MDRRILEIEKTTTTTTRNFVTFRSFLIIFRQRRTTGDGLFTPWFPRPVRHQTHPRSANYKITVFNYETEFVRVSKKVRRVLSLAASPLTVGGTATSYLSYACPLYGNSVVRRLCRTNNIIESCSIVNVP